MISADQYKKSSFSKSEDCVEVRLLDDGTIGLRDSKDVSKPPHRFTRAEWETFVAGVRAGEFDLSPTTTQPSSSDSSAAAGLLVQLQVRIPGWAWGVISGAGGSALVSYLLAR